MKQVGSDITEDPSLDMRKEGILSTAYNSKNDNGQRKPWTGPERSRI
jgi:hypothetical protein